MGKNGGVLRIRVSLDGGGILGSWVKYGWNMEGVGKCEKGCGSVEMCGSVVGCGRSEERCRGYGILSPPHFPHPNTLPHISHHIFLTSATTQHTSLHLPSHLPTHFCTPQHISPLLLPYFPHT